MNGAVYDLSPFVLSHPGGIDAIAKRAGTDVTSDFNRIGHSGVARTKLASMLIGQLETSDIPTETGSGTASSDQQNPLQQLQPEPQSNETQELVVGAKWHQRRRALILEAHPEIAELAGTEPITVLLAVVILGLHGCCCVVVKDQAVYWAVIAAATVGAFCRM